MESKNQKSKSKKIKDKSKKSSVKQKDSSSEVKNQNTTPVSKSRKEPQTMDELLEQVGISSLGLKKGDEVEAEVVSKSPKEILFDIGKKSYGILARWELEQVKDYADTLEIGDKVTAQIMNPENDSGYAVLSLRKSSSKKRWDHLAKAQETGQDLEVTGVDIAKGGLLVEWQTLRGFIPASQLDTDVVSKPTSLIGKRVKVKVLEVDKSLNRLVLSQKAATLGVLPKELKERLEKIKPNTTLKGRVSGIAPFGLFVDIDGLEGLVHISEIAWERVEDIKNIYKSGDEIDVLVLEVNKDENKLNLSIKRLTPDPWKNILDKYPIDSTIQGSVVRIVPYGVFVQIEPGIEGLIHISKLTQAQAPEVSDEIECVVESIDPVKRKMSLNFLPKEKPVGYR